MSFKFHLGKLEKYIKDISEWHTPATDYEDKELGNFRIHHGRYRSGMYRNWGVSDCILFRVTKPIPIVSLQQKKRTRWHTWMVDDPPQWWAMQIYAKETYGKVLTTGLGLGLIIHELVKNPEVNQITVVERSPEVIELMSPYIPREVNIVTADFFDFIKNDMTNWSHIIVDLWVAHGKEDKMRILYRDVLPMLGDLVLRYPEAKITFHGFQTVSYIKPVSEEMAKLVTELSI